jgi:DNA polymerase III alpha subunit
VKLGGLLTNVRQRVVGKGPRSGQKWATATLGDKTGTLGAVIFSEAFGRHRDLVANDAIVALTGRVDRSRGEPSVIVESVLAVDELDRHLASRIELDLVGGPDDDALEPIMQTLEQTLRGAAGNGGRTVEVLLHVHDTGTGPRPCCRPCSPLRSTCRRWPTATSSTTPRSSVTTRSSPSCARRSSAV